MFRQLKRSVGQSAVLIVLALILMAMLGCSDDDSGIPAQNAAARNESSSAPLATATGRLSGEHLIAAVIAGANQEPYRFDWSVALAGIPSTPPFTLRGTGAVDPAAQRYEMSMDLSSIFTMLAASGDLSPTERAELAMLQGAGTMEFLVDRDTAYLRSPLIARELGTQTPWISVSAKDFPSAGMLGGFSQMVAPTDLPAMLQGVGDLRPNGSEVVRSTPATRWDGTIDLVRLAQGQFAGAGVDAADLQEFLPMLEAFVPGISRLPVAMWVDGDNRLRRLEMSIGFPTGASGAGTPAASMTMRYELFDFGAAVVRAAPVATEVTDLGSALSTIPIR